MICLLCASLKYSICARSHLTSVAPFASDLVDRSRPQVRRLPTPLTLALSCNLLQLGVPAAHAALVVSAAHTQTNTSSIATVQDNLESDACLMAIEEMPDLIAEHQWQAVAVRRRH